MQKTNYGFGQKRVRCCKDYEEQRKREQLDFRYEQKLANK